MKMGSGTILIQNKTPSIAIFFICNMLILNNFDIK